MKTTRMHKLSDITLSMWFVSVIMIMQGAEAGTCLACTTTFAGAAGLDREKLCSAANTYLECAEQDCKSDGGATIALAKTAKQGCGAEAGTCLACTTTFEGAAGLDREKLCSAANTYLECAEQDCKSDGGATIALAKTAKQGCGAGSIIVNLAVIGLGLTFYMLV
ncbi:uncharacterized protein LOC127705825 isoform X2 [Mytilus californianus]|uniref:uncharacterized protein LOC127705825 isoform X2 n=1 Tax=Mytilus californianus TaxID=6549 RepID=UPI00224606F0|nr:uncharacterized protein LOC127705825 isoform X2 [Mytilus californianus]